MQEYYREALPLSSEIPARREYVKILDFHSVSKFREGVRPLIGWNTEFAEIRRKTQKAPLRGVFVLLPFVFSGSTLKLRRRKSTRAAEGRLLTSKARGGTMSGVLPIHR